MGKKEYDFGFAKINVNITGHKGYRTDRETGEQKAFVLEKFTNVDANIKTEHSCYQSRPLEDVENDVDLIKHGDIKSTNFYKHWMKLFFGSQEVFEFVDLNGEIKNGHFTRRHNRRENTFYFNIAGQEVKIADYKVIIEGQEYLL